MARADKQTRRAALKGEVLVRTEDGKQIVDVYGGQLAFDGETVTLTTAFLPGRGTVAFRATDVRAVQWREAGRFTNGRARFVVPGASDLPQAGNYWTKTGKDERDRYELTFTVTQADVVRSLCDAIMAASRSFPSA